MVCFTKQIFTFPSCLKNPTTFMLIDCLKSSLDCESVTLGYGTTENLTVEIIHLW